MICRRAQAGDYEGLVDMARIFTEESGLPLTFNEEHARETLWASLHRPEMDFIVVVDQDLVVAGTIIVYEAGYYDEICAYVDKFFVHREFRGLAASDTLLQGVLTHAGERQAKLIFATATAGMGASIEKLYVRLFRRHGFEVLGRIIMREV